MTTSPNFVADRLIERAIRAESAASWLLDSEEGLLDTSAAADALLDCAAYLRRALHPFDRYSDGRPIETVVQIETGVFTSWLWPADPADLPTTPFETGHIALPPFAEHGDRGYAVVTFDPADYTATIRFTQAQLRSVR